jgi:phosphate uptake regulator
MPALPSTAKHVERSADHATNLAETVELTVTGRRHPPPGSR